MPSVAAFGIDVNGNGESRVVAWDFKNFPEITVGGALQSSPAPTLEVQTPDDQPSFTIAALQISGTQVQALMTISGATANYTYPTVCRAYFSATEWGYVYGDLLLVGPS